MTDLPPAVRTAFQRYDIALRAQANATAESQGVDEAVLDTAQALVTALCAWQRAQDVAEIRKYADAFDSTFPEGVGSDLSRGRRLAADHLESLLEALK